MERYHIVHTSALEGRIRRYKSNHKGYTRRKDDWEVVYKENFLTKNEVYAKKRYVKRLKGRM